MKELSVQEKAKAYDEAKLRMSAAYNSNRCTIGFMNEIFPELKESEDERIRKEIIESMRHQMNRFSDAPNVLNKYEKWIAWLEKQGEKKPAESKKHDVCDNCDQQGSCVSPCPMKLIEKHNDFEDYIKVE